MTEITEDVLCSIAGVVESLLLEQREGIAFAYQKIPKGLKVNIGITLDQKGDGVAVSYSLGYPLEPKPEPIEKQTVKKKHVIGGANEQAELI